MYRRRTVHSKGYSRTLLGLGASNMSMHGSSDSRRVRRVSKRTGGNTQGLEEYMKTNSDDGNDRSSFQHRQLVVTRLLAKNSYLMKVVGVPLGLLPPCLRNVRVAVVLPTMRERIMGDISMI